MNLRQILIFEGIVGIGLIAIITYFGLQPQDDSWGPYWIMEDITLFVLMAVVMYATVWLSRLLTYAGNRGVSSTQKRLIGFVLAAGLLFVMYYIVVGL